MFGSKTQVQVQSASGLFADANKLRPESIGLAVIKGVAAGAVGGVAAFLGYKGAKVVGSALSGVEREEGDTLRVFGDKVADNLNNRPAPSQDSIKRVGKGLLFSAISGAVLGAVYKGVKAHENNKWANAVLESANRKQEGQSFAEHVSDNGQRGATAQERLEQQRATGADGQYLS